MSYRAANGEWLPGAPPRGSNAPYVNSKGAQPPAAELRATELNLADTHPRQAVPVKWCTEKQVETVLGLSIEQMYGDPELVGAAQVVGNEVMFDASVVVERAYKAQSGQSVDTGSEGADEVGMRADNLLAELRRQGHELPGGLGGDAA